MKGREVKEVEEIKEVKEKSAGVAAFFDLDGTLLPLPSLERRFFAALRFRGRIGAANAWAWLREALRLWPRGIGHLVNSNKAYLRGVPATEAEALAIPEFFPEAVRQAAWHAEQGHQLVIVSGTLEPLAWRAGRSLTEQLGRRGLSTNVEVCATKLELAAGSWTGRVVGEAMFGEAKGRAVQRFCAARRIAAADCFAYGDSANDRSMLEAVGRPQAVNPSDDLARIARRNGWPILWWGRRAEARHLHGLCLRATESANRNFARPRKESSTRIGDGDAELAGTRRECWRGTE